MWRELRDYLAAILRHWRALVLGIFGGLVGLATNFFPSFNVPPFVWLTAALLGLVLANFLAYRAIRRELATARVLAAARANDQEVREGLGRLLSSGEDLRKRISKHGRPRSPGGMLLTHADADVWNEEFWAWIEEVEEFLRSNRGPHYVDRFRSATGIEDPNTDSYILTGPDHIPFLNSMHYRLTRLNQFLGELRD